MIGAIVLAAGEGRRMGGGGKAMLEVGGVSFLERVIRTSRDGGCEALWVVSRSGQEEAQEMARSLGCRVVINEDPGRGMFSSVVDGLSAALSDQPEAKGFLVFPVDHPRVHARTVRALIDSLPWKPVDSYALPVHQGRGGHPILVDREGAHTLTRLDPASVLRHALKEAGMESYAVEVADPRIHENLNTLDDLP